MTRPTVEPLLGTLWGWRGGATLPSAQGTGDVP